MSAKKERAILTTLRARGPMGVKSLAVAIDAPWRTVANLCSSMKATGALSEVPNEHGTMHGRRYSAEREVLWRDVANVRDLLAAYGPKAFRELLREARTP